MTQRTAAETHVGSFWKPNVWHQQTSAPEDCSGLQFVQFCETGSSLLPGYQAGLEQQQQQLTVLHDHCQPFQLQQQHPQHVLALQVPAPTAGPGAPWCEPLQVTEKCHSSSSSSSNNSSSSGGQGGATGSGASSCSGSTPSGSAVVVTVLNTPGTPGSNDGGGVVSIYDLYTRRKMYSIMLVVALAALTAPLSNTIFLPAMQAVQQDLHTTAAAITGSVASFQVAIGLGALLWGPASDRYGRRPVLLIATVLFALTNVPLILAPDVAVLLAFRTLQGAAIAAYASAGPGMVADVCSPETRGTLFGVCSVAALLGPVLGPPLGGGLSQAFGWRSMFVLLAGLSALVILPLLLLCVPETLQYKILQRLSKKQPAAALKVAEAATILGQGSPKFQAPWWPLRIALDRTLLLHVLVILLGYGTYICSLAVLPFYLSRPPYSMSTGSIGAVYIPGAIAAILASPCGGKLADCAARSNPQQPLRRMVYANLLGMPLMPMSFLLLGWGLQKGLPLALALVACFVASFVNSLYMPALFTVLTIIKQDSSAAAVGGVYALLFLLSGTLMLVASAIVSTLGLGPFLTIMATLHLSCTVAAFIQIIRACRDDTQMPQGVLSTTRAHGSAVFLQSAYRVLSTSLKDPALHACSAEGSAQDHTGPAQAALQDGCRSGGGQSGGCSASSRSGEQGGCGGSASGKDVVTDAAAGQSDAAAQLDSSSKASAEQA